MPFMSGPITPNNTYAADNLCAPLFLARMPRTLFFEIASDSVFKGVSCQDELHRAGKSLWHDTGVLASVSGCTFVARETGD